MNYEDYIEQRILYPLNMAKTTPRQPVPPALGTNQARGYIYSNDAFQQQGIEYISIVPAGGLNSSATDMARFMIAHLQNGRFCQDDCVNDEVRNLSESTAQQMQTRLWTAEECLNGMAYDFMEFSQNGYRVVGHSGDTSLFHSIVAPLPEENVGLFVSYHSQSSSGAPHALLEAFMDHYFPAPTNGPITPIPDSASRIARYTGTYQLNRVDYNGGGKILGLMNSLNVIQVNMNRVNPVHVDLDYLLIKRGGFNSES